MSSPAKLPANVVSYGTQDRFLDFVPPELLPIKDVQKDIPRIAKDPKAVERIERAVQSVPTKHKIYLGDAREMVNIGSESVHLILTSPPYWTLKDYRDSHGQLGHIEDYEVFLDELDKVWTRCLQALV